MAKDIPYGVGVLVAKDGKFLCGLRSDTGELGGPGGHIVAGEDPKTAAARELQEEFGINAKRLICLGCLEGKSEAYEPSMVFLCTDWDGEPRADGKEMLTSDFLDVSEAQNAGIEFYEPFKDAIQMLIDKDVNQDGGLGSGNFGHAGIPGQRGGSASKSAAGGAAVSGSAQPDKKSNESSTMKPTEAESKSSAKKPAGKKVGSIKELDIGDRVTYSTSDFMGKHEVGGTVTKKEKDHAIVKTDDGMNVWIQDDYNVETLRFGDKTGGGSHSDGFSSDGGPGSGNFGHAGRPGQPGGSAPRSGSAGGGAVTSPAKKQGTQNAPDASAKSGGTTGSGKSGGGASGSVAEQVSEIVKSMTPEEKALYDKAHADSEKAVGLLDKYYDSNMKTWDNASAAVKNGEKPVTATAAAKDHTIPGASSEAQELYEASRAKEKQISEDLIGISNDEGCAMYGLDFSVKTGSSVANKIERKQEDNPSLTDAQIVGKMGDLVRYTQLTDHDKIADTAKATVEALQSKGYNVIELDNKYQDPKSDYKGIHIGAVSPSGQTIELQVHSAESMRVKETIHPMYDVFRDVNTPPSVKKALSLEMRSISQQMATPAGVDSPDLASWKR